MLVPSDWAVICSAKPLRSYLLADFIKRYINKLIYYYITIVGPKATATDSTLATDNRFITTKSTITLAVVEMI